MELYVYINRLVRESVVLKLVYMYTENWAINVVYVRVHRVHVHVQALLFL